MDGYLKKIKEIEKLNLPNDRLRDLLIDSEEELDKFVYSLQRMYGLTIPQEDFEMLTEKKEKVKAIQFIVLKKFKSAEIK